MDHHSKGGKSTVARYGRDYMREIGKRGGQQTARRYGSEYMASIGKSGAEAFYRRYQLVPIGTYQFAIVSRATGEIVAKR